MIDYDWTASYELNSHESSLGQLFHYRLKLSTWFHYLIDYPVSEDTEKYKHNLSYLKCSIKQAWVSFQGRK